MQYRKDKNGNKLSILGFGCMRFTKKGGAIDIAKAEQELLEAVNATGIGPQGLGGRTTALAVQIETMPTHIAGLPVAVNINCHVSRHRTEVL